MRLDALPLLVLLLAACATSERAAAPALAPLPDGHHARNALDWSGTYEGVLPCADCPGIRARLTLGQNGAYGWESFYLERSAEPLIACGTFRWLPDGNQIELDDAAEHQRFFVSENRVIMLGPDGARPSGPLADHYVLHQSSRRTDSDCAQAEPNTAAPQPRSNPSDGSRGEPTEEQMRDSLQAYIDHFNAKDAAGLAALFADDGRIEDPVGGANIVKGRVAIDAFYRGAVKVVDRLELVAPIRTSEGRAAAMAFDIHMRMDGRPLLIRAIDVMTFDSEGKIVDMKAYHGPSDRELGD